MKPHTWEVEEVDGGTIGIGHFWKCRNCGASGGPVVNIKGPTWEPFLAGWGPDSYLSYDCDEAVEQIKRLRLERENLKKAKS